MDEQPTREGHASRLRRRGGWGLAVPAVFVATGLLFAASALSADGGDLRPEGADLSDLVAERTERVAETRERLADVRAQVQELSGDVDSETIGRDRRTIAGLRPDAGFTRVSGPGLRVVLTDAPREVEVEGLDPNLLVVHQQDIQAFVNAMWAGGAEAVTLQGQRLISTTGIKCVGNTVVLDGVPYSPPYVIEAVGAAPALEQALRDSPAVDTYTQYVARYRLGLDVEPRPEVVAPAYEGAVDLRHARVAG